MAAGDTLVKADQLGNLFTFKGSIGLAPEYKNSACDARCQEAISACLEAHINTSGVQGYAIRSLGKDNAADSTTYTAGKQTNKFDCDIVYSMGSFVQWPEGMQTQ